MAQTLPDCYRITFTWLRTGNDEIVETFHLYAGVDGGSFAEAETIAQDTATWLKTAGNAWRNLKPSTLTLDKIVIYDMSPGSLVNAEVAVGEPGLASGSTEAHQISGVITWLTAFRGAPYRGRTYIGPLPAAAIASNGLLGSSWLADAAAAAPALHGHFLGLGFPMMVASFTHQALTDITGARIDDAPDVQRRRQVQASTASVVTF